MWSSGNLRISARSARTFVESKKGVLICSALKRSCKKKPKTSTETRSIGLKHYLSKIGLTWPLFARIHARLVWEQDVYIVFRTSQGFVDTMWRSMTSEAFQHGTFAVVFNMRCQSHSMTGIWRLMQYERTWINMMQVSSCAKWNEQMKWHPALGCFRLGIGKDTLRFRHWQGHLAGIRKV